MRQQDWTDKLRKTLADYEADVPEELWVKIEQSLPQQKAPFHPAWYRWAGVAAMLTIVIGTSLWYFWPMEKVQPVLTQNAPLPTASPTEATVISQQTAPQKKTLARAMTNSTVTGGSPTESCQPTVPSAQWDTCQVMNEQPILPTSVSGSSTTNTQHPTLNTQHPTPNTQHPTPNRMTLSLHTTNGLLAFNHKNGVQMSPEMANRYDYSDYLPTRAATETGEPIWLTGYEERQHHSHPIAIGLTASYALSERLSIGSGLIYTWLKSDFTSVVKQTHITTKQTLHYIGIPLNVEYRLLKGRKWSAYVSSGIEADWNISARSETEGVKTTMSRDRLQFSLGAAIGAEYEVLPRLNLYAEPGFRYYFDNGSSVQNFFKEKPASWSLQLGVRFNLSNND